MFNADMITEHFINTSLVLHHCSKSWVLRQGLHQPVKQGCHLELALKWRIANTGQLLQMAFPQNTFVTGSAKRGLIVFLYFQL